MKKLLATILLLFVCGATFGQDSLKRQFNNYLYRQEELRKADSAKKAQEALKNKVIIEKDQTVKTDQKQLDSLKNLVKDLKARPPVIIGDTTKPKPENIVVTPDGKQFIISQDGQLEPIILREIDTINYINRIIQVRRYDALGNKSDVFWDKLRQVRHDSVYKTKHELLPKMKVFGWHPYWMGNSFKSYNFSLLSHVAYFSYEIDPKTGNYKNINNWRTTALVDSAKKYNTKVLLSVTNFGPAANAEFLKNPKAQRLFTDSLKALLQARNADGINIDFEYVPKRNKNDLTNFIISLATELRQTRKDYQVTLAIPAIDFDSVYDIKQLDAHIDLYVIMGYEFYGRGSEYAGPVSPIQSGGMWWEYNLERSLDYYNKSGVPPEKLLMGLPYYGSEWETEDLKVPSKAKRFVSYRTYRNIRDQHGLITCCDDPVSMSRFYGYRDGLYQYRQIWFEDAFSLAKKYDWVLSKKIGGVGIWALGYDNGYTDLWRLLGQKFATSPKASESLGNKILDRLKQRPPTIIRQIMNLVQNPYILITRPSVLMTLLAAIMSFNIFAVIGIRRYSCKWGTIPTMISKILIVFFMLVAFALVLHKYNIAHIREMLIFLVGVLITIVVFFLFSRNFFAEKDLP